MYETFFQFNGCPFPATPVVANYFPAQVIESARQALMRVIERAEGPGIIVGPSGVGKSLLLAALAVNFLLGARVYLLHAAGGGEDNVYENMELFTRVLERVRKDYVDGDKLTYQDLIHGALKGMLNTLDPHSAGASDDPLAARPAVIAVLAGFQCFSSRDTELVPFRVTHHHPPLTVLVDAPDRGGAGLREPETGAST